MLDFVGSLKEEFIAYQGSLTTPPCSEAVSWLVAKNPRKISWRDVSNKLYVLNSQILLSFLADEPIQEITGYRGHVDGAQLPNTKATKQPVLFNLLV